MYKAVIFTLGTPTAERELNAIRAGASSLLQYFDDRKEEYPIDGYTERTPKKAGRTFNMRPIEVRSGSTYLLIVPTRAGAVETEPQVAEKGTVVDRKGYFVGGENIVGVGLCRLHSHDYQHGDIIIPDRVDNSPSLVKMWGEDYKVGFPDEKLRDALYQKCVETVSPSGLSVIKLPRTVSLLDMEESKQYGRDEIQELLDIPYGARELEMGWVLANARKLGKPAVGTFAISDRSGERADDEYFFNLPERVHTGVSKLLESVILFFVQ